MYLENIVVDALDPRALGSFWEALLGTRRLTDGPEGLETRLHLSPAGGEDGPFLDLCFQPVPEPPREPLRLHLDLLGGSRQEQVVARARDLGARPLDIGQGAVPWVVLGDVEGNPFCVMEEREVYSGTGPIAALPLDSADPARDADFWSRLTGWVATDGVAGASLRHPSGVGPLLELCQEPAPKPGSLADGGKNRMHLDVRLEAGEDADAVAAEILARGGQGLDPDWGELPWRVFTDPSGNEFCVLPASSGD
ncbi:glyoxalase-like domain protein [Brachybacterium endophyticum]|uniref:Glyoxalase-like domain protein n=1 Tax=Brachybacterium endophyticum TaxID=2182385 RepID=A0A2U2RJQ3_9MICO|nr:VOC family protein [Brachybacterium endophyticum]PWH06061.1 glyoxalase-like domain protein [Brachybacterium endophyticum]